MQESSNNNNYQNRLVALLTDFSREDRGFLYTDLLESMDYEVEPTKLMIEACRDKRFLYLGTRGNPGLLQYIPKRVLFCALAGLNITAHNANATKVPINTLISWISHVFPYPPSRKGVDKIISWARDNLLLARCSPEHVVFIIPDIIKFHTANIQGEIWEMFVNYCFERKDIRNLESLTEESLSAFLEGTVNSRNLEIAMTRMGILDGLPHTLREVGTKYGLTRERVRQIEQRVYESVEKRRKESNSLLKAFVALLLKHDGRRVFFRSDGKDFYRFKFISKVYDLPFFNISGTNAFALGINPAIQQKLTQVLHSFECRDYEYVLELMYRTPGLYLRPEDREWIALELADKAKKKLIWPDIVYFALREIGKPAHYVEIAAKCKELFPSRDVTPRKILAILCREPEAQFEDSPWVWTGSKGIYALREWGYDRPHSGLYKTVFQIVNQKHKETAKPVSMTTIMAEIGKHRKVINKNSVSLAAYCNPGLKLAGKDHFVPASDNKLAQNHDESENDYLDKALRDLDHLTK